MRYKTLLETMLSCDLKSLMLVFLCQIATNCTGLYFGLLHLIMTAVYQVPSTLVLLLSGSLNCRRLYSGFLACHRAHLFATGSLAYLFACLEILSLSTG